MKNYKIKQLHKTDRPREKLAEHGVDYLSNSELLAILIGSGYKGKNVIQLSKEILSKYNSKNLSTLTFKQLISEKGIGRAAASRILSGFELAKRIWHRDDDETIIQKPDDAVDFLQEMKNYKKEHFVGLYLDGHNKLIFKETISIGSLNANFVHPREAFVEGIKNHCAKVIFVHNHPSGFLQKSKEDMEVTKRLVAVGDLLGICVVDHIIISKKGWISFSKEGWM